MAEQTFIQKVIELQQEFVASKTENNDFGGYKYRNIEVMLGSLKPLLKDKGLLITFGDKLVFQGDRYYIEATATLTDGENELSASSLAREEFEKKKSDASQLTGSASTYARKYALCGLLGVDDGSNDPDSKDNDRKQYTASKKATGDNLGKPATDKQVKWIKDTTARVFNLDNQEEIDKMVQHVLTIPAEKVPLAKVKAAVDRLELAGATDPIPDPKREDVELTDEEMDRALSNITELPY